MLLKAKGFRGKRSTNFRYAKDAIYKAQSWAYRDRKNRKRTFRNLWVQRINAACRSRDITYSRFVEGLKHLGVELDRKVLLRPGHSRRTRFRRTRRPSETGTRKEGRDCGCVAGQATGYPARNP